MPKTCQVTGKKAAPGRTYTIRGIAKKKKGIGLKTTGITKRRFRPNIQKKRVWFPEESRFVTLKISTDALRTIDKKGIGTIVRELRAKNVVV